MIYWTITIKVAKQITTIPPEWMIKWRLVNNGAGGGGDQWKEEDDHRATMKGWPFRGPPQALAIGLEGRELVWRRRSQSHCPSPRIEGCRLSHLSICWQCNVQVLGH